MDWRLLTCLVCAYGFVKDFRPSDAYLTRYLIEWKNLTIEQVFIPWLTFLLLNTTCPVWANSVDPDQLASEEANWSGSALFVIQYVNIYQQPGSSYLIGWKLEVGVAS